MTEKEVNETLSRVTYKESFKFRLMTDHRLHITRVDKDSITGTSSIRVYPVPIGDISELDASALIHRAFRAVLNLEEHECCEAFKVDGIAPFDPHLDVFKLMEVSKK